MKRTSILLTNLLITFVCSAQNFKPLSPMANADHESTNMLISLTEDDDIDFVKCLDSRHRGKTFMGGSTTVFISDINSTGADTVKLTVFPNPNKGSFTVSTNKPGRFMLMNILGDVVQQMELNQMNDYTMNIQDIGSGVYFIRDEQNRIRQRIVVTR